MRFVKHYIKNNDEDLLVVKKRSGIPFTIIDSVLDHYGLPVELKYLAVIESELKPTALSRVGAKGPWQLMPGTAHELGLKVNHRSDERTSFYKSTSAAAKYLKDLHREFGDWLLVLAAYNGGPVPVYRAIRKAHSRDFWTLQRYLPAESRNHVKRFIATAYYFERNNRTKTNPQPVVIQVSQVSAVSKPNSAAVNRSYTAAVSRSYAAAASGAYTAVVNKPNQIQESTNERFNRVMMESANSLKKSNELLTPGGLPISQ
ncbi:MAG TPA: lytic transglycosylase domain-containing protein [Puia sp.]|jgi:membrane-bound lytic murein transglycosylase D